MERAEMLQRLLNEEMKLSEFRKDRWETAERRLEAVWNNAIAAARATVLGVHDQSLCQDANCFICWRHKQLGGLLRLDRAGYVPVRERLATKAAAITSGTNNEDYTRGVYAMLAATQAMFGEME